jgi:hypothetical protein
VVKAQLLATVFALALASPVAAQTAQTPPDTAAAPIAPPVADGFPREGLGLGPRIGSRYAMSRSAEDWSFLRDKTKRKDRFDPLKFIPLNADASSYLTLSGELRFRIEDFSNPGLKSSLYQDSELIRTFVGADLHLGDHVRVFGELASGQQFGRIPDNPNERNDLFVQQLFVEVHGRVAGADAGIVYGRQDFLDGPMPLISGRENNNIHTVLQGTRAYARWDRLRVSVFDVSYITLGQNWFDDPVSDTDHFRGANASLVVKRGKPGDSFFVDPFYYHNTTGARRWGTITGREARDFYGLRVHGNLGPAAIDWTASYQGGSFDDRPIRAWSVSLIQTLQLSDKGWAPTIGFHADAGSGGGAFGKGPLRDADFLFGTAPYLNDSKFFGPINLASISPTISFTPIKKVTVRGEYTLLHRLNVNDAVYNFTKIAYAGTQNVPGHDIGAIARLRVAWALDTHITVAGTLEHAFAGPVLDRAGFSDSDFGAAQVTFRF